MNRYTSLRGTNAAIFLSASYLSEGQPLKEFPPLRLNSLTLLHSEQPNIHGVLAVLSAVGLRVL